MTRDVFVCWSLNHACSPLHCPYSCSSQHCSPSLSYPHSQFTRIALDLQSLLWQQIDPILQLHLYECLLAVLDFSIKTVSEQLQMVLAHQASVERRAVFVLGSGHNWHAGIGSVCVFSVDCVYQQTVRVFLQQHIKEGQGIPSSVSSITRCWGGCYWGVSGISVVLHTTKVSSPYLYQ